MPPEGRINSIDISAHDPDRVYVAGYRFLMGDFAPYIWKTEDAGETWESLADGENGIPADFPVRVVREDPGRPGLLYAGTEFGMFVSFDDGRTWGPFQRNLPVTPITGIQRVGDDIALSTMGRGFWVMDDVSRLHELDSSGRLAGASPVHLFAISPQKRTRPFRNSGFGWRNSARPEYRGAGAMIDYWIGVEGTPVTLDILDADGNLVRSFSATASRRPTQTGAPGMRVMQAGRISRSRLSANPGAHRFVWDLRGDGTGRGGGPMVPPGDYSVRLTAGDATVETDLELRIDPRVTAEGVTVDDLVAQHELELAVRETIAQAREVSSAVSELGESVGGARESPGGAQNNELAAIAREVEALEATLVDAGGSYPRPMLLSQINYLLGMISRADQAPGRDAYERHEELKAELDAAREKLEELQRRMRTAA
jgi:hypothetical protein